MRPDSNARPAPDSLLVHLADYALGTAKPSAEAMETARYCLMDSIGCAILALSYPECARLLGPIVPGTRVPSGTPIPGTAFVLDPMMAAFNIGSMVRWLDFNDTWLAAEWGHPSDNLGAILAVADSVSRGNLKRKRPALTLDLVLRAMVKAHEIQGVLALENSFNRLGFDHVLLVRIASTAVATWLMGGSHAQIVNALTNAWLDGGALRTYRHAPNTGRRKSWAAGDATARAVLHAWMALRDEMGYPSALTAAHWGFQDVMMRGQKLKLNQPLGSYVMENVLFKISFPAEFHAQTAVEAALQMHPQVEGRLLEIEKVMVHTQESAMRIINKSGPLHNPADRDHCLQYMVAVALIFGELTADHYEDAIARDPRVDALRKRIEVAEDPGYTRDYLDPSKRSISNAVQVIFRRGKPTAKVEVEYPVGHRRRRAEGIPLLKEKFRRNLGTHFEPRHVAKIVRACEDRKLGQQPVNQLMDMLASP